MKVGQGFEIAVLECERETHERHENNLMAMYLLLILSIYLVPYILCVG